MARPALDKLALTKQLASKISINVIAWIWEHFDHENFVFCNVEEWVINAVTNGCRKQESTEDNGQGVTSCLAVHGVNNLLWVFKN